MNRYYKIILDTKIIAFAFSIFFSGNDSSAEDLKQVDDEALKNRLVESLPQEFFSPLTLPSNPIPIQHLYAEWEPAKLVLISVPLKGIFTNPELLEFVKDFLRAIAPHIPVGILYNREEEIHLGRFIQVIENDSVLMKHLNRFDFIESSVYGFWIRDHGPQFALSIQGDLVTLDSIYRILELEALHDPLRQGDIRTLPQKRYSDDLTPQFVNQYLRSNFQYESVVVRAPLHLHGGDFATDGKGNVFTSEHTISENGGDWEYIEKVLNRYYGAENIHVLNPPKGNTAKHLDLLFKIASEDTYFVSQPPSPSPLSSSHGRFLGRQIARTLENNLNYIERNLPGAKVVELPMPSLLVKSRAERLDSLRGELLNVVSRRANIDPKLVQLGDPKSPEVEAIQSAIALEMLVRTGMNINLSNESHLDIASKSYLGVGIDGFLETYVNREANYRSYTNSLIVTNPSLEKLILLPRFFPQEGESQEFYDQMEKEVEESYLGVYPNANLKWIHSDHIMALGGSIHCMSISVPLHDKLKKSRSFELSR